ncbi:MAG: hypothetical protein K8S16_07925 [Bacteroidales bacterium]|nr:hypothetical protein [Bacteroidales bacterium]
MKKTFFSILLTIFLVGTIAQAQDESSYMMIMVKHKKSFKMASNEQDFQNLANNFERIAKAESDQWHPLYYASLCYINMSFVNKDNDAKDAYLDKAQTYLDQAIEIYPDESELFTLQALLHQGRIQIDPAGMGMNYSMKANESLEKAKLYNPENPRVYYLQGMNILHTPESFGGGTEPACKLFKIAKEKFSNQKPGHVLSPTWGAERNEQLFGKNCGSKKIETNN